MKNILMQRSIILVTLFASLWTTGCDRKGSKNVIQVVNEDDLTIERDGRPIVEIRPYENGTSIKILSAAGEWIQVSPTSPSGLFEESVYMERNNPDGTTFFLEVLADGTAINRSEFPIGKWPGDDGYEEQPEAEDAGGKRD